MDRRAFLGLTGAAAGAAAAGVVATPAEAAPWDVRNEPALRKALADFAALPGLASYAMKATGPRHDWSAAAKAETRPVIGSAFKTFVLVTFLRQVEAGRASLDEVLTVDDGVRAIGAPVFQDLTGKTTARSVLEAMMSQSDNTATDIAMKRVGVGRIRAFLTRAGLASAQIPDSTRIFASYCAGAPLGVDEGWAGMLRLMQGEFFGPLRSAANGKVTMKCSAADLVSFYERALNGEFFKHERTLKDFRHIQTMAEVITDLAPPRTLAYVKNGWFDWKGLHGLCVPGQLDLGETTVTFCFSWNWEGPDGRAERLKTRFYDTVGEVLVRAKRSFG